MKIKTKVVHCKKEPYDIYIGRTRGTDKHYGNPFKICVGCSREESIHSFRMWITGNDFPKLEQGRRKWILDNLHKLKYKIMGCWCSPKACHGDVLAELADKEEMYVSKNK